MSNKFTPVLPSQYKLLKSNSKLVVAACEPGAGATYGLALKAIYEAQQSNKFILFIGTWMDKAGGLLGTFYKILEGQQYRYSKSSQIFTFPSGSRIKLASFHNPEIWIGCNFDWIICDHRFAALDYSMMFKAGHIAVSAYPDVVDTDEWFKTFYKDGKFEDFVEVIKFKSDDNFFMEDNIYFKYARESLPEHFGFKF